MCFARGQRAWRGFGGRSLRCDRERGDRSQGTPPGLSSGAASVGYSHHVDGTREDRRSDRHRDCESRYVRDEDLLRLLTRNVAGKRGRPRSDTRSSNVAMHESVVAQLHLEAERDAPSSAKELAFATHHSLSRSRPNRFGRARAWQPGSWLLYPTITLPKRRAHS